MRRIADNSGSGVGRLLAIWLGINALLVPLLLPILHHPVQRYAGLQEIAAALVGMADHGDVSQHHAPGHVHDQDHDCALCSAAHAAHGAAPLRSLSLPVPRIEPVSITHDRSAEPAPQREPALLPRPRAPPLSA